jgi:hypothetical protein
VGAYFGRDLLPPEGLALPRREDLLRFTASRERERKKEGLPPSGAVELELWEGARLVA